MVLVPMLREHLGRRLESLASRLPFHPDVYTLLSLPFALIAMMYALQGEYIIALPMLAVSFALDGIDGAVARAKGLASRAGAFLDSTVDRIVDAAATYGLYSLAGYYAVALMVASLVYSYARARGESLLGRRLEGVGFLERGERSIALLLVYLLASLGFTRLAYLATITLSILMCIAAAHRIALIYLMLRRG